MTIYSRSPEGRHLVPSSPQEGRLNTVSGVVALIVFASLLLSVQQIQLAPHFFDLSQEYTALIFGKRPEILGLHPLFSSDSYQPLFYLIPWPLLKYPAFAMWATVICAIAPLVLLFLSLRQMSFSVRAGVSAIIITYSIGWLLSDRYLQLPNPFSFYNSVNFRMTVFPAFALFVVCCSLRRWILAGLLLGVVAVSHAKFGVRMWVLTDVLFVFFWLFPKFGIKWIGTKAFLGFQAGFLILFIGTAWHLFSWGNSFWHSAAPRVAELIPPLGFLIKNEPDDWLLLYLSPSVLFMTLALPAIAVGLSFHVMRGASAANLKRIAAIGLVSNLFALLATLGGLWLEYAGLSMLPPRFALTVVLIRPWDYAWIPVMTIGLIGILNLETRTTKPLRKSAVPLIATCCLVAALVGACKRNGAHAPLVAEERLPDYSIDHAVLEICSDSQAAHSQAKVDALQAIWNMDLPRFLAASSAMSDAFKKATDHVSGWTMMEDPEALNLKAIFQMRVGKLSDGLLILRMQNQQIKSVKSPESVWQGDVIWGCAPASGASATFVPVRKSWSDFDKAAAWIDKHTDPSSRVIQMAPLTPVMARTKRVSFWENKIDSHPMYSFPAYYGIGLDRLAAIAGPSSNETTPGYRYGDAGEASRRFFLSLTRDDFARINQRYGRYEYILTEADHKTGLPLVYANETYAVFRCCEATD
jgi:hypothetical protein